MTEFSDRSAKAYHNGKLCEEMVKEKLPDAEFTGDHEVFDFMFMGAPLEVKGCEGTITDNYQRGNTKTKSGRFYLRGYQHNELLQKNGRYAFFVLDGGKVVKSRIILASKVCMEFEGAKTLSYGTVFKAVA